MVVTERRRQVHAAPASEPRAGEFRAIGAAVAKLAAPIIARQGGGHLGRLKAAWPVIAGSDWAQVARPVALRRDGALKLHVAPTAALELQHCAPLLIERVNLFLGTTLVTRLSLVQALPPPIAEPTPPRRLNAEEASALERAVCRIADPQLRAALCALGRAVFGSRPPPPDIAPDPGTG
jgi:hypothetical protein